MKLKDRQELRDKLRAIVGLKPRKARAIHDTALGHLISYAINTSANKNNGNVVPSDVAEVIKDKIFQLELVLAALEQEATR